MLFTTWLYALGALGISLAAGTGLLGFSRRWWNLVLALTAFIGIQILLVNGSAWDASRYASIWMLAGAVLVYPAGLLLLGGLAFVVRRMQRTRRMLLCIGLAVPIYLSSTVAGILIGCATDLECMRSYAVLL